MNHALNSHRFDHLLAEIDACLERRDYSAWSPLIAGWQQWAALARAGEWQ